MSGNCDIPITITVSKPCIRIDPDIEPDPVAAEYVKQVIRRVEGRWFGKLFDNMFASLFDAMPSPLDEDYRRRSVDVVCHGT